MGEDGPGEKSLAARGVSGYELDDQRIVIQQCARITNLEFSS